MIVPIALITGENNSMSPYLTTNYINVSESPAMLVIASSTASSEISQYLTRNQRSLI
jgi:hypothetical protein